MLEISDKFPDFPFGTKYPRVYQAESIEDMQQGRAEQAKGLRRKPVIIPSINFGGQPYKIANIELTAIIFLPEVQHYPAMDPQEDIKRLYGATIHDNWAMKLADNTGGINVWYDGDSHSDFPFRTCFDEPLLGRFDRKRWQEWRDISWRKPVILLAQYSEVYGSMFKGFWHDIIESEQDRPVTEYYWLLHILEYEEEARRGVREERQIPNLIPVPTPSPI